MDFAALVNKLQGYKTYMVATAAALTAVVAYLNHQIDLFQLGEALLTAAGAATIRHGVNTTAQKVIDATNAAAAVAAAPAPVGVPNAPDKPADPNDLG
jgi:hypothetical protein